MTCKICFSETSFQNQLMTVLILSEVLCLQIRDAMVFTKETEGFEKEFPQRGWAFILMAHIN